MSDSNGGQEAGPYSDAFNVALQWLWGDGFLSPGGEAEVDQMLSDVSVDGREVLEVGSGLGAAAVLLVERHGAAQVVGVDVQPNLIEQSSRRAADVGLGDRIRFELVEPGPLPMADDSFDVVFTKDAVVHMPDKPAFYAEVMRVLRPGGLFVGSDWLRGGEETYTDTAREWLAFVHLDFQMQQLDELRRSLEAGGFDGIELDDRNDWYRTEIQNELAAVSGDRLEQLAEMIGAEEADYRARSSSLKRDVIELGFLRPTHFVARVPQSR